MPTIRNKYSGTTATPPSLEDGEIGYSRLSDNLFIGVDGDNTVIKIGGKSDVDKLATIESGADITDEENVTNAFPIVDDTALVYKTGDSTARVAIDAGAVSSGQTRVITMLNQNLTLVDTNNVVHTLGDIAESVTGNKTFNDNIVIEGDLTVSGNTTYVNTTELQVGDSIITLNADNTETPTEDAGIEVERGGSPYINAALYWDESEDEWVIADVSDGSPDPILTESDIGSLVLSPSITLTAGIGLAGGGDLSANRTFDLDITELTALSTIADDDYVCIYDTDGVAHKKALVSDLLNGGTF